MTCEEIEEKIADYSTGRLDAPTAEAIARHLAACASCRRFAADVRTLYGMVEVPLPLPAPGSVRSRAPAQSRPHSRTSIRVVRGAIAALFLLGLALVLYAARGGEGGSTPPTHAPDFGASPPLAASGGGADLESLLAALPLLEVAIALPCMPTDYRVGTWIESREEADLMVLFTGKPLLEQYLYPGCPICIESEKSLDRPEVREALAGFVCFRGNVEFEVPEWLEEAMPANPDQFPLPAMRVTEGELESEPRLGVSNLESLLDLVREWNVIDAARSEAERGSIDERAFAECSKKLRGIAELVEQRAFTEAVSALDELVRFGTTNDTAFASCAADVLEQLQAAFDRQLAEIERLYAGNETERRQAIDLARRFRDEVRGLPIGEVLAAYVK